MAEEKERVQKVLSMLGVMARRKAEAYIKEGRVKVNGTIVSLGDRCLPGDEIAIDDHIVSGKKKTGYTYLMLYKPVEVISTLSDPQGRKTVKDLLPSSYGRLFPVGRLDYLSEGLLLMTDDGEFANLITHPSSAPEKEYVVRGKNGLYGDEIKRLANGLYITKEGYTAYPAKAVVLEDKKESCLLSITIHEGKKREIRHMMETLGHPVLSLKRVRIGEILLGNLQPGEYKAIDPQRIQRMKEEARTRKRENRRG